MLFLQISICLAPSCSFRTLWYTFMEFFGTEVARTSAVRKTLINIYMNASQIPKKVGLFCPDNMTW